VHKKPAEPEKDS